MGGWVVVVKINNYPEGLPSDGLVRRDLRLRVDVGGCTTVACCAPAKIMFGPASECKKFISYYYEYHKYSDLRFFWCPFNCWSFLFICRTLDRRSHYEPSVTADEQDIAVQNLEEQDVVPHFQRVSISGEDTSGVS